MKKMYKLDYRKETEKETIKAKNWYWLHKSSRHRYRSLFTLAGWVVSRSMQRDTEETERKTKRNKKVKNKNCEWTSSLSRERVTKGEYRCEIEVKKRVSCYCCCCCYVLSSWYSFTFVRWHNGSLFARHSTTAPAVRRRARKLVSSLIVNWTVEQLLLFLR